MSFNVKLSLDATGKKILALLQENARLPFSEIGRRVGLSTPAVSERVRRMEEAGILSGYRAEVDPLSLGYALTAYVRLHTTPERYPAVLALAERSGEVLECAHVTGEESFVMKVAAQSVTHLEDFIARFSPYGKTSTSIVLSTPIRRRVLQCAAEGEHD